MDESQMPETPTKQEIEIKPIRFNAEMRERIGKFQQKDGRENFSMAVRRLLDLALKAQGL
jgi:hypothetical protein